MTINVTYSSIHLLYKKTCWYKYILVFHYKMTEIRRVLISQKTIDYCAGKLIENRAREIFVYRIATHEDEEFHNSSLVSYYIVTNITLSLWFL